VCQEKLLGSLLFEYQATDPNHRDDSTKQYHIFVSINNSKADAANFSEAYDLLLYLLAYRHKILYIYQEACNCNPQARKYYSKLDKDMRNFSKKISDREKRLDIFRDSLEKMPPDEIHYSLCLRDLKAHYTSITTNIVNYRTCLDKIAAIGEYPKSWDIFVDLKCNQWKQQIQIDIDFLSPGQELFGQMIQTIRGIVEIDQAESDRIKAKVSTERTRLFAILGFSATSATLVTSGSILSAQVSPHVEAIKEISPFKELLSPLHPQKDVKNGANSAISIGLGFSVFFLVAGGIYLYQIRGSVTGKAISLIRVPVVQTGKMIQKLRNRDHKALPSAPTDDK
jgi:hypothetical protein